MEDDAPNHEKMKIILVFFLCLTTWTGVTQTNTSEQKNMKHYLLHGKLTAKEGHTDELANILLRASEIVSTAKGCIAYVVSKDPEDSQAVYVTEIWKSKEDHTNSLKNEEVRELIGEAIPMLAEQPERGKELEVLGGAGIE